MITVESSPKEFQLARNPILLELSTDNQFDPVGVAAGFTLTLDQIVTDGDSFILKMDDETSQTFTFRNSPDSSGLEIETDADLSQLVVNIKNAFETNYYLSTNYTFAVGYNGVAGEGYVTLDAKNTGAGYNGSLQSPPTGMSISNNVTGVTEVERLNFAFVLQIYKRAKSTSDWTIIERRAKPYKGTAVINLAECLDDEFWKTNLPNLSTFATVANNGVGQYKVRYAEAWNLPREIQGITETSTLYFAEGGLSRSDHLKEDFYDRFLDTTPPAGFMTWINHPVELYSGEFHVLTYLRNNSTVGQQIELKCTATALDGATSNHSAVIGIVSDYDVASIKVTPAALGLDESNLRSFKVWIVQTSATSTAISKVVQFNFNTAKPIDSTCLVYQNGFGFFDTFNLRGNKAPKISAQKTTSSRASETYLDSKDHYEFVESVVGGQAWNVNTGFQSKAEMSRLFDLILSKRVFLVSGTDLIPVTLDGSSELELFNSPGTRINNADITVKRISDNRYGSITT